MSKTLATHCTAEYRLFTLPTAPLMGSYSSQPLPSITRVSIHTSIARKKIKIHNATFQFLISESESQEILSRTIIHQGLSALLSTVFVPVRHVHTIHPDEKYTFQETCDKSVKVTRWICNPRLYSEVYYRLPVHGSPCNSHNPHPQSSLNADAPKILLHFSLPVLPVLLGNVTSS